MAKLGARGRTELVRISKDSTLEDGTVCKTTLALMSDNKVLEKVDFRRTDGSKHTVNWTVRSTVPKGTVADAWRQFYMGNGYS